ncbi:hypothetical protein [Aminobacter sp. MDW-2]|uniref:hypothetical protein n=1 Tax=Aminobacter sp. MDW-2 TaxID=2666139 RepID=UPI0012B09303|nr:hypothetical protein [Aminobacter sp. MDW-2]MRX32774.1 hypothetical protein [Aminobacter sp. MDW-2]QNH34565.1 hypothetical protein H5P29_01010 [Aminobacter sp. MDW-2]
MTGPSDPAHIPLASQRAPLGKYRIICSRWKNNSRVESWIAEDVEHKRLAFAKARALLEPGLQVLLFDERGNTLLNISKDVVPVDHNHPISVTQLAGLGRDPRAKSGGYRRR